MDIGYHGLLLGCRRLRLLASVESRMDMNVLSATTAATLAKAWSSVRSGSLASLWSSPGSFRRRAGWSGAFARSGWRAAESAARCAGVNPDTSWARPSRRAGHTGRTASHPASVSRRDFTRRSPSLSRRPRFPSGPGHRSPDSSLPAIPAGGPIRTSTGPPSALSSRCITLNRVSVRSSPSTSRSSSRCVARTAAVCSAPARLPAGFHPQTFS